MRVPARLESLDAGNKLVRLFFAAWPPPRTAQALGAWASKVAETSGGKLMRVENIHLTLAFLGEVDPALAIAAATLVRGRKHELPIDAARYWKDNNIVWVGPARMPLELAGTVAELHKALGSAGFALEERPFAAHITLLRKARVPASIPPLPAVRWPVNELLLVQSRTSPKGSTYEPLERFALAG
jgi:RNA 2',3'-cyclic 3'-phosphodiesterase